MEQQPSSSKGFDLAAMHTATKIIFVAGILLLIFSFLPWQRVCIPGYSVGGTTIGGACFGRSAWGGSASFAGVLMGILLIVLLVWEGLNLGNVKMELPITHAKGSAYLAWAIAAFAIIKILIVLTSSVKPSLFGWIGLILALVVAYGGWLSFQLPETMAPPAASPPPAPPAAG